jgi:hypothetical protein
VVRELLLPTRNAPAKIMDAALGIVQEAQGNVKRAYLFIVNGCVPFEK